MQPARRRIVARPAEAHVEPEPRAFARDIRLGHVLERRADAEGRAFHPGLGRQLRQLLEAFDELRAAIRIARIIERIDADIDVARARGLGPAEREAEEDGVARRHIGDGDIVAHTVLGHVDIGGERRSAECAQVHRHHDMAFRAQRRGDAAGGGEFDLVALVIVEGERVQPIPRLARKRGRDHRIESAGNQYNCNAVCHRRALLRISPRGKTRRQAQNGPPVSGPVSWDNPCQRGKCSLGARCNIARQQ